MSAKKYRDKEHLFVAEGSKLVSDLMVCFTPKFIAASADWLAEHDTGDCETAVVESEEMKRISFLSSPSSVLALFEQRVNPDVHTVISERQLILALDSIQDPGNLGTIVRIADWFGIRHILCSMGTVDVYNAKTVQSTMGAIARVYVHYVDLESVLLKFRTDGWNIYGTFLDGESVYGTELPSDGVIIMGNEGKGISDALTGLVTRRLFIPPYPAEAQTVESLNVAVATAVICSEFRRRG